MKLLKSQGFLWKILTAIGVVAVIFLITLTTLAVYMVIPLGHRATDDLASIIFHAAERWDTLPVEEREGFEKKMWDKHELVLSRSNTPLPKSTSMLPYLAFLETSLARQLGKELIIKTNKAVDGTQWFWVDIPISEGTLRFGFSRERIGVEPSTALFVLLAAGIYLIFISVVVLTRRLTIPIDRLYHAAQLVGKGQWPEPVKEEGTEELVVLARGFNRMNIQVKELLTNRTTLLAGIAHDLRTPLTQIQLALSMLPNEGGNKELMESIRGDLDTINHLIDESLNISLELSVENAESTDVVNELDSIINNIQKTQAGNVEIKWKKKQPCLLTLPSRVLRRILTNLLVNALRYGNDKPVTVNYECKDDTIVIHVMDRGAGIPDKYTEAVFSPFFRLEKSRSSETGGSGLGLAIVRQLADTYGWTVELLPRAGGGTNAVLTIPCAKEN